MWRDGQHAPLEMSRGAAVVNGNVAYFMNCSSEIFSYNSTSEKWSKLPKCPYTRSSLAVINGQLTTIGGYKAHSYANILLSLQKYWIEAFPPMPTKRHDTAALTSKEHLIVAGGSIGLMNDSISTVEVMDTEMLVWSTVASLPHPYTGASGIICGDQLYMLGENDNKGRSKCVLTCSLKNLIRSSSSSIIINMVQSC